MNRYCFLDIDGVLNSHEFFERTRPERGKDLSQDESMRLMLDPDAIIHLNAIVRASEAKIVISSTWRQVHSVGSIMRALRARGFEFPRNIIGRTGYRSDGDNTNRRGLEIQDWLNAEGGKTAEPCGIVILDDSSDMGHLLPYLVRTTYQHGLLAEHVPLALNMLGIE